MLQLRSIVRRRWECTEIALCANDVRERTEFMNRPLMSENEALGMALNEGWSCFVAIGRNEVRRSYLQKLTSLGAFGTLIHPEAILVPGLPSMRDA